MPNSLSFRMVASITVSDPREIPPSFTGRVAVEGTYGLDTVLWLDGGHNPSAGAMLSAHFGGTELHLILGMLDNKDPRAIIAPLGDRIRSLTIVPVPNHDSHPVEAFGPQAKAARDVEEALLNLPSDDFPVLIAGSLYLAGEVLRLNDEVPD